MVRRVESEKAPGGACARLERDRDRLDRRACRFMLQSPIGKTRSIRGTDTIAIAMPWTEHLHRVGRERTRAFETAMDHPRMLPVLGEVLAAHHDRTEARVAGDVVVDVLRRVRLVVGDEGADAESQILHEDCIDRHGDVSLVRRFDTP